MSAVIGYQRKNKTLDCSGTLLQSDGTAFNIATGDRLLVKIGRKGSAPVLSLDSDTPTDNGSDVTITVGSNAYSFRVVEADANDLDLEIYDLELVVVDASEASGERTKFAQDGEFIILGTMTG